MKELRQGPRRDLHTFFTQGHHRHNVGQFLTFFSFLIIQMTENSLPYIRKGADNTQLRKILTENMRRFLSKLRDDRLGQKQDI